MSPARLSAIKRTLGWTVGVSLCIALYQAYVPYSLAYNVTPSIPVGLYLAKEATVSDVKVGDLVCIQHALPDWAASRRYLPPGIKLCKYLAAKSGDIVDREGDALRVHAPSGESGYSVEMAHVDSKGRELPQDALRNGPVPEGFVLVLAPDNARSLDSRYLGYIPEEEIVQQIWPLATKP